MSSNRVHYFIRNILQNSKFNRANFVKNKKLYNEKNKKNNNSLILKRNYSSSSHLPPSNNNNNNNNHFGFILLASLSAYFHIYGNKKN